MSTGDFYTSKSVSLSKRYAITLDFLKTHTQLNERILDLGIPNPLSDLMTERGFSVKNTEPSTDLDLEYALVKNEDYDILTAFEILEHLVSPFPLLQQSSATKLFASVPLKLWFANAYWSEKDPYDRHYHEFEPRQFDMLLEKAGWKIVDSVKWKAYDNTLGVRPILRRFTDRYYLVYCTR